ncbi:DUF58 domain-containing protein [Paracoccus denitrificans]|nr:DUF58 domain-containing protein [Paracoccus denitrificans]MBB4629114.1 uncharacterized protein (DUF58 family) [Paracoccus denitrificans]MCU7431053.1 DUF58 domain-containing protein [Paracoccus denitrificans]UPV96212.1 DUF58 domain-containing protein [Paracoccus denitrificans]WQO34421.1 DUF58 domain-containing protein [Paracoccus denitrificans]SDJ30949.1 Protein of unknown function DUF58 [Paracoccus denitrificans]
MVAAALDHPGLRLTAAELIALRPPPRAGRHRPASRRPGAVPARVAGQGMDLREIRAFAEGDDLRRIDPGATARTGQLHVRSFHEDRDDTTLLIADFRHAMLWGTGSALRSVRAARWLARIGWQAVARGASVALMAVGDGVPALLGAGTGAAQMQALASLMARAHDAALDLCPHRADLAPALAQARRMVPPGGQVHLATGPDGLAGAGADAALSRLARGRRMRVHLILDPAETVPPDTALSVSNGHATRHGRLSSLDPLPLIAHLRGLGAEAETVMPDDTG